MTRKKGQLSNSEIEYIKNNYKQQTSEQIAEYLNRSTKPIDKVIAQEKMMTSEVVDDVEELNYLRLSLQKKSFWSEVVKQFDVSTGELKYFEDTWVNLIKQFREDVLPAEELQIKQFITIDILINRSMKERKRHIEETEKLQRQVDLEYKLPEEDRDTARLANLETQLSFARNSIASYTNEYTKLLSEQQKISKDLKATREQRIKRIEDGKSSWTGLLRMLEDEDIREKEGRQLEILNMSKDKFKNELHNLHQYQDGELDRPILNSISVELEEDDNSE